MFEHLWRMECGDGWLRACWSSEGLCFELEYSSSAQKPRSQ